MNTRTMKRTRWLMLPLLYGCMAALTGCSAETPPIDALSTADMALNRAIDANAAELAPLDLRVARDKLDIAKSSMNQEDYVHARRLAEESRVNSRVAEAKARAQTASDSTGEVRKAIAGFQRDEARRATEQ